MIKRRILTILLHILAWAIYLFLPNITMEQEFEWSRFVLRNREIILLLIYFYLNIYLIIPKLLENKKIAWFTMASLACFTAFIIIQPAIDIYVLKILNLKQEAGFGNFETE